MPWVCVRASIEVQRSDLNAAPPLGRAFSTSQLRGFAVSRGTWNDKLHVDAIPMKLSQNRFDLSELVHALDRLPKLGLKRWSDEAFKAVWRFASHRSPWGAVAE